MMQSRENNQKPYFGDVESFENIFFSKIGFRYFYRYIKGKLDAKKIRKIIQHFTCMILCCTCIWKENLITNQLKVRGFEDKLKDVHPKSHRRCLYSR